MARHATPDVLIVGAGPAGCVLANRLSEDPGRSVLLLEAGPDYGPDPATWPPELIDPSIIGTDLHSWGFHHAGRPAGRPLPRARVAGGSSAINASAWVRGSAADYDAWAAAGNPGWTFDDLLPAFRRSESDPIGGPLHGTDGPVPISRVAVATLDPFDQAVLETARALAIPFVEDVNGDPVQRPAVGPAPTNIASGVRMNAALTYLAEARSRPNLTIVPDTEVDRVEFAGARATGVRTVDGTVFEAAEVVLAAGSYGSPAILMRSGVGAASLLRQLGIPVVLNLPGVGAHLLDHPMLEPLYTGAFWPISTAADVVAGSFIPVIIKARSRQPGDEIDLHLYVGHTRNPETGAWGFGIAVSLMDARSQGRVSLTARDPGASLQIDHGYFSEPRDLEAICDGFDLALDLVACQPLAGMLDQALTEQFRSRSRDEVRNWVRERVSTTYHPSSTCRMGPAADPDAVVDHRGRVHGLDGLQVVDASIFPAGPRANLHCTVVAVAEKLAGEFDRARAG